MSSHQDNETDNQSTDHSALASYSLLRVLHDEGKDHIDCFLPLVLATMPHVNSPVLIRDLQEAIRNQHRISIPIHSLDIILTRAKRRGFVQVADPNVPSFALSADGVIELRRNTAEPDVRRRINELLIDARGFVENKHGLCLSEAEVEAAISAVVQQNVEIFASFIGSDFDAEELSALNLPTARRHEIAVLDYFKQAERNKPAQFDTLKQMIAGSILAATVYSRNFAELDRKMVRITAVFDSNFLFRLFSFDHPELNGPAIELFELMQKSDGFDFRVFDFTIDEMVRTLRAASKDRNRFIPQVRVDHIHSGLQSQGVTPATIQEFIVHIEERLAAKGVLIIPTNVQRLDRFTPQDPTVFDALMNLKRMSKPNTARLVVSHDIAALEQIRQRRRKRIRRVEEATPIFVTADAVLARHNHLEWGHKDAETVAESTTDRSLTSLLWIKFGDHRGELTLRSIIAMHSGGMIVNEAVWDKFKQTTRDLCKHGSLSNHDVSILLFSANLEETLGAAEVDQINERMVLEQFDQAKKSIEVKAISEHDRKITEQVAVQTLNAEMQTSEFRHRTTEALEGAKGQIRNEASDWARRWLRGIILILSLLLLVPFFYCSGLVHEYWDVIEPTAWLVSTCVITISVIAGLSVRRIRRRFVTYRNAIEERLFNHRYLRKLNESHLCDVEAAFITADVAPPQ